MADATIVLLELLRDNWNPSQVTDRNGNQVLGEAPDFHSGWYDREGNLPAVTFSNKSESPISGGNTDYYGTDSTGLGMNLMGGALSINFVAGTRAQLEGAGQFGRNINPKQARSAMTEHGRQILIDNQRQVGFRSLNPGAATEIEDTDDGPTVYRTENRVRYTYTEVPSQTA